MDPSHRPSIRQWAFVAAVAALLGGCSDGDRQSFQDSHDRLREGMSLGEVFDAGLADYLARSGRKNAPGATLPAFQPVSAACARHVLDVAYSGVFIVRVYCNRNEPSARQLVPEHAYADKRQLVAALDTAYKPFARNMTFRIESPPKRAFGVYDHYTITTDADGRVAAISPVVLADGGN